MTDRTATMRSLATSRIRQVVRDAASIDRIALAGKSALAATIAWLLGRVMPGFLDEYAYYAPFGAVVAMMPSIVQTVRTGWQSLLGLAAGSCLAWGALLVGIPAWLTVPVVVGAAILIAGLFPDGPSREYLAVAAVFVLIAGGGQAEAYGVAYVMLTAVGIAVGAVVNLAVLPPLHTRPARQQLDGLASDIRAIVEHLADAVDADASGRPGMESAARLDDELARTRHAMREAQEARRMNPRARSGRHRLEEHERRLARVAEAVDHVQMIASIADAGDGSPLAQLDRAGRETLAASLRVIARLPGEQGADATLLERAVRTLAEAQPERLDQRMSSVALAFHLRRLAECLDAAAEPA